MNPVGTSATFDVGPGSDRVYLVPPLTNAEVILGEDRDPDLAVVFYKPTGQFVPEWTGSTIENVGPGDYNDPSPRSVAVTPQGWQDRIMVRAIP